MNGVASIIVLSAVAFMLAVHLIFWPKRIPKGLRLPPGPHGKAISGNAADMPSHHEWETFSRWGKEYGGIVCVKVYGKAMIIVNSVEIAVELFERRSRIYSDRFDFPMLNDLMGLDWIFALMRYGERWRRHRKMFHQEFQPAVVSRYQDIQIQQSRVLLRRLHETPEDYAQHIRRFSGAVILKIIYGFDVLPGDRYIETAEKVMDGMAEAGIPGAFLVDSFPILKYVPEWFIGAGFQKKARTVRILGKEMVEGPFLKVIKSLRSGTASPSVLVSLLESVGGQSNVPTDECEIIRNTAAVAYQAGSDTTTAVLTTFMLAMLLFPEAQQKAQAELDLIVGMCRLPEFYDRENLPYVNVLCKEVLRWHAVAPMAIAHRVIQDDVFGEFFIPKGSVVLGNAWAMLHDEKHFGPEPKRFRPERFLDPKVRNPTFAFGFGRRICPGRHLADNSIFIAVASILQVFDITPANDNNGHEIAVQPRFTSGLLTSPEPFCCSIKPRAGFVSDLLSGEAMP